MSRLSRCPRPFWGCPAFGWRNHRGVAVSRVPSRWPDFRKTPWISGRDSPWNQTKLRGLETKVTVENPDIMLQVYESIDFEMMLGLIPSGFRGFKHYNENWGCGERTHSHGRLSSWSQYIGSQKETTQPTWGVGWEISTKNRIFANRTGDLTGNHGHSD